MKYIYTACLSIFISMNSLADDEKYIEWNKEISENVRVAKIILSSGLDGYVLTSNWIIDGAIEAQAGNICQRKGYFVIREETQNDWRKLIIRCNE